jgi:hypothetical protein
MNNFETVTVCAAAGAGLPWKYFPTVPGSIVVIGTFPVAPGLRVAQNDAAGGQDRESDLYRGVRHGESSMMNSRECRKHRKLL